MVKIKKIGKFHDRIRGELFESECSCGCKFQYDYNYPMLVHSDMRSGVVGHYLLCPDCGQPLADIYDSDGNIIARASVNYREGYLRLFNNCCADILLKGDSVGRDKTKAW
ncbi:MAG TPA: hypothetical protein OIM52_17730 [Fusicatenibacter saccharivorans]|nr:hypothetical protein [Fusicatenibacter saccharivorans]